MKVKADEIRKGDMGVIHRMAVEFMSGPMRAPKFNPNTVGFLVRIGTGQVSNWSCKPDDLVEITERGPEREPSTNKGMK